MAAVRADTPEEQADMLASGWLAKEEARLWRDAWEALEPMSPPGPDAASPRLRTPLLDG